MTKRKLEDVKWEVLPQPPVSPDISPCNYFLFLSLLNFLRNNWFNSEEEVQIEVDIFFFNSGMNLFVFMFTVVVIIIETY